MARVTIGTCRYCQEAIRWARTTSWQRMPLNYEEDPYGNIVLEDGIARMLRRDEAAAEGARRYTCHLDVCPLAETARTVAAVRRVEKRI